MREKIRQIIGKAIGGESADFSIEIPGEKTHGDYSTNAALVLAKKLKLVRINYFLK